MIDRRWLLAPRTVEPLFWILLLVVAVVASLWFPHPVGHSDEGYFLQHTKRVLVGHVAYRDFHET